MRMWTGERFVEMQKTVLPRLIFSWPGSWLFVGASLSSVANAAANPCQRARRRSCRSTSYTRGTHHLSDFCLCRAGLSVIERAVLARFSNSESTDGMAPLYCSVRPIDGQGSVRQFKVSMVQP